MIRTLPLPFVSVMLIERQVGLCELHLAEGVADFDAVSRERQRASLEEDLVAFTSDGTAVGDGACSYRRNCCRWSRPCLRIRQARASCRVRPQ